MTPWGMRTSSGYQGKHKLDTDTDQFSLDVALLYLCTTQIRHIKVTYC